jgi:general secretion pathway protein H
MTWRTEARPARRRWQGSGAAGFTLIEMLIVLAVIGLAAGIIAARGPWRSHGLETRALVASVAETLRAARGRAIATNRTVLVAVNGEHHSLSVEGGPDLMFPPSLGVTAAAGPAGVAGKELIGIRFAPDGSSTGGRILLADGKRQTRIAIDWLTGRISVADVP